VTIDQAHIWIGIHTSGPSYVHNISNVSMKTLNATYPFRDNLGWQFGTEEGKTEDGIS